MKTRKLIVVALTLTTFVNTVKSQDPTVMTINDKKIKKSEFEAVYRKNNGKDANNSSKSVKEYVDLFSLYKSKVFEAESLGLDTLESFKAELEGYRRQLAAPYLTDKNTNENLLTEAYERMKTEVRASHILIKVDESALPKDTLEAWTRINIIRNGVLGKFPSQTDIVNYEKLLKNSTAISRSLKNGDSLVYKSRMKVVKSLPRITQDDSDNFQIIASVASDDPSANENKGDLNYFSALDMVYPFETAAYTTKIGEVSSIVRTRFGYHVLKVYDRRTSRGEVTVAHIMAKFPKEGTDQDKANAKAKIDEIYSKLKGGQSFDELAKQFSDDKQSSDRGGQLQPFKGGRLPKAFEDAAFGLRNNNDYTQPVLSPFGWHIIKRIELKTLLPFDEMKNELKARIARDSRSQMGRVALIERVKKENGFKENVKNIEEFKKIIDSTYLKASWSADRAAKFGNKEVFVLAGKSYKQSDFAKFLESQMAYKPSADLNEVLNDGYKAWVEESIVAFEDSQLEKKYVDFANLYREYRDGILLFDLTDQKVWTKAVKDTAGLNAFYEKNKNNYLWDEMAEVTKYKCLNEKVAKNVRKALKSGKSEKQITESLNKTSQLNVSFENITYLKGENKNVDENWKKGVVENNIIDDKNVVVMVINNVKAKSPKTLGECRGNVTADYQSYLDQEWLAYLKAKYKVQLNQEVLDTIK